MIAAGRILLLMSGVMFTQCQNQDPKQSSEATTMQQRLAKYTTVRLTTDMSALTANEREMIPHLVEAAKAMDDIFWMQAYGNKDSLMASIRDENARRFVEINYGPWDRLAGNEPFIAGAGEKPKGANFYPPDMTKEEFEAEAAKSPERAAALRSLYTLVRRDAGGKLVTIPYHQAFAPQVQRAVEALRKAADLAGDAGLRTYLLKRIDALLTDDYQASDMAWLDMKTNTIDVAIGPIETYEDALFGYKAANEAYILVKDKEWSKRLSRYAQLLPGLQRGLPVPAQYKREKPGTDSDLNAYDAIYYAGDCNAGSKTIAINLPNDEEVQLKKGTRRLQLKNSMQAKFDKILVPIAELLVAEDQQRHVTFDAFFGNTMFHEVAHGLGIKNTVTGKGTVRDALKDQAGWLEEGKADILGLYMVSALHATNELGKADLMDNYITFMAGIFRSIRFGAASAHGKANLVRFNYFNRAGAFTRDEMTRRYSVNFDTMKEAMNSLSEKILRLQGDGDYDGVKKLLEEMGTIPPVLEQDLARVAGAGIPVDIVFEQGMSVLTSR
jgi:hypothetical protein